MAKTKNPFEKLAEFYKEGVENGDKKGFSELYKTATEIIFKRIRKETGLDLHFEDVRYEDGYFIFGYGTNSVVRFRIKEAPGWLGGIWWAPQATEETKDKKPEKQEFRKDILKGVLFFQFEEEIDKFKPSASMFGGEYFNFYFEENGYTDSNFWDACCDLEFIIKEPYLAFYKEMTYTDFNHEYISREKAKRFWNRHWKEKEKKERIDKINTAAFMDMVKYIVKPMVEEGEMFIIDHGDILRPRYEIIMRNVELDDGDPIVKDPGIYHLFDLDADAKTDEKLWKKARKECEKRAHCRYYSEPCYSSVLILNTPKYKKLLKKAAADGTAVYYNNKEKGIIDTLPTTEA